MNNSDQSVLKSVVTSAAVGGLVGLAVVGSVLAFDVSSIGTMISSAAEQDLISALLIGGTLTKGMTVGAAVGLGVAFRRSHASRSAPALSAIPAIS